MPSEFTIVQIIQFQQISQYLAANDKSSLSQLRSGSFIGILPQLLYMEGTLLQNMNALSPGIPTLRGAAEYVLSLCGKYAIQAQQIIANISGNPPVLTGPTNQSVLMGNSVTFSVSAIGVGPFTYQWFDSLGNPIVGAVNSSYSFPNAQLSDTGKTFFVKVTNASGTTISNTATLTVTTALVALTWYGDIDPNPDLQAGIDNLSYQIMTTITHNQPIIITIPQVATPNKYFVTKVPIGESIKTAWFNTALNSGNIPDANYQNYIQFNGFTYYYSRTAISFDYTQPLIFS